MPEKMEFKERRERLAERLKAGGILRSPEVVGAMKAVPREEFVLRDLRGQAYIDTPLPIGRGQTISAPHMVGMMAEAMELAVGHRVLEIGAGSGYHAAVVAEIVAPEDAENPGHVYTVEIIPELAVSARENLEKTGYASRVTVIRTDGSGGYPDRAPYDRILVTAAAPQVPKSLIEQLKVGGLLVIPVGGLYFFQDLLQVRKTAEGKTVTKSLGGVAFVPLTGEYGWRV